MTKNNAFMLEAIELSRQGFPAPNPHVGCVIVKEGEVVGRGYHDHAGAPHAEVVALRDAGAKAKGSDVYVTLEPCNHQGRTPPCSQALIDAQVASVTIACQDPNPKASGGLDALQAAGIKTSSGLCEEDARKANEQFLVSMKRGWPFVQAKVAMSLDGRVALPSGESKWITNELSRSTGHKLRAQAGAVLVGRNTVVRDNPLLTSRVPGVTNQPTRIVLDPNSALTGREKVFGDDAPTLHVVKHPLHSNQIQAPYAPRQTTGEVDVIDLRALLKEFFSRGITGVLIEGGPVTIGHFLRAGLIDRLHVFMAPVALGAGMTWLQEDILILANATRFHMEQCTQLDGDLWITYRPSSSDGDVS